jgi:hypothetical protein
MGIMGRTELFKNEIAHLFVKIEKDIVMMCPSCDFKASMIVIHRF